MLRIAVRIIGNAPDHLLRIVAGPVSEQCKRDAAFTPCVGAHLRLVSSRRGDGNAAAENGAGPSALKFRLAEIRAHRAKIRHRAAEVLMGHRENKGIIRLQDCTLGHHETLADRAVGGLPEVAALRVLEVRAAGNQRNFHIRKRRPGQHARMLRLEDVREDKPLPVEIQVILAHGCRDSHAAPGAAGLKQQVYLRVMPERLKMPDAFHSLCHRFFVNDTSLARLRSHTEALLHDSCQHLNLHFSHDLKVDAAVFLIPGDMEHRILLGKREDLSVEAHGVDIRGKNQASSDDRLNDGGVDMGFVAEAHSWKGNRKPCYRADLPLRRFLHLFVLIAGIEADLVDFFSALISVCGAVSDLHAAGQHSFCDAKISEAGACAVSPRLVNDSRVAILILSGVKFFCLCVCPEAVEQSLQVFHFEGGAEPDRKKLPLCGGVADQFVRKIALFHEDIEKLFIACRRLFGIDAAGSREVDAVGGQLIFQVFHDAAVVCAGEIHLIHEDQYRNVIVREEAPQRAGVGLDAVGSADDEDGAVKHLKDALGFRREIDVAGGVEEDHFQGAGGLAAPAGIILRTGGLAAPAGIFLRTGGNADSRLLREDCDAAVFFYLTGVKMCITPVDAACAPDLSREIQQRL